MTRKKNELIAPTLVEIDGLMCKTFTGENLTNAWFEGQDLSKTLFCDADLSYANLAKVRVHGETIEPSHELRSLFVGTKLCHANLHHADLRYCYFRCTDLGGADLRGADLQGAVFSETKITNADLRGSDLSDAVFEDCSCYRTHFDGAILKGVSFKNVTMLESQVRRLGLTSEQLDGIRIQAQIPTNIPTRIGAKKKSQMVFQYTPNGKLVGIYSSLAEMNRKTGIKKDLVHMSCETTYKKISVNSYYWSYEFIQQ